MCKIVIYQKIKTFFFQKTGRIVIDHRIGGINETVAKAELRKFNAKTRSVVSENPIYHDRVNYTGSVFLNDYEAEKLSESAKSLYYRTLLDF